MRHIRLMCLMTLMSLMSLMFPAPAFAGELANQFTISLYVNPQTSIASKALVVKDTEIRLVTDSSGNPLCQIHNGTDWQTAVTSSTALTTGSWAHVSCTYNKSNIYIYINGVQTGSGAQTATVNDAATNLLVGQDDSGTYGNFIGTTDQMQIYNYARSQKQIVSDMGGGAPAVIASGARQSGAVGHWSFDEGYGTTANNSGSQGLTLQGSLSGFASPATSTSGWTQAGKFGRALLFDGSNDYVSVTRTASLEPSNVTISCWVKFTAFSANHQLCVTKQSTVGGSNSYALGVLGTTNKPIFVIGTAAGAESNVQGTALSTGTWYHLTGTYDGTNMTLYVNGTSVATSAPAITIGYSASYNFVIGAEPSASAWYVNGSIDEVKIYNYALTADEIKLDYNQGSSLVLGSLSDNSSYQTQAANQEYCIPGDSTSCTAPVGRWDFEEGTGSTVYDKSGNANNGTWAGTGSPHWTNGKVGKAGKFNGSDDYVNTTGPSFADNDTAFTLAAWVKTITTSASGILTSIQGTNDDSWFAIRIAGGKARFYTYDTDSRNLDSTTNINDNKWHYIVATFDTTSGKKLYLDGRLENSNAAHTAIGGTTNHFHISTTAYLDVISGYFSGSIDQAKIFNYARSAAQVAWDYNRGAPVGHWKFDECQGSVANDSSGNSNTGTITIGASGTQTAVGTCTGSANTAWKDGVTGKINYSLDFDGTDDYVSMGDINSLDGITQLTLSAWVKPSSLAELDAIAGKFSVTANTGWVIETGIGSYGGSNDIIIGVTDDGSDFAYTNTNILSVGTWAHIIMVYDGSQGTNSNRLKLYVNGTEQALTHVGTTLTSTPSTTHAFRVGATTDDQRFFPGQIDDARVYNYALTATQVKNIYNGGAVRFGPSTGAP